MWTDKCSALQKRHNHADHKDTLSLLTPFWKQKDPLKEAHWIRLKETTSHNPWKPRIYLKPNICQCSRRSVSGQSSSILNLTWKWSDAQNAWPPTIFQEQNLQFQNRDFEDWTCSLKIRQSSYLRPRSADCLSIRPALCFMSAAVQRNRGLKPECLPSGPTWGDSAETGTLGPFGKHVKTHASGRWKQTGICRDKALALLETDLYMHTPHMAAVIWKRYSSQSHHF